MGEVEDADADQTFTLFLSMKIHNVDFLINLVCALKQNCAAAAVVVVV